MLNERFLFSDENLSEWWLTGLYGREAMKEMQRAKQRARSEEWLKQQNIRSARKMPRPKKPRFFGWLFNRGSHPAAVLNEY